MHSKVTPICCHMIFDTWNAPAFNFIDWKLLHRNDRFAILLWHNFVIFMTLYFYVITNWIRLIGIWYRVETSLLFFRFFLPTAKIDIWNQYFLSNLKKQFIAHFITLYLWMGALLQSLAKCMLYFAHFFLYFS